MTPEEKILRLENFKQTVHDYENLHFDQSRRQNFRSHISQERTWVRQQIIESGCFHTLTLAPPPAIGGLVMNNIDPIQNIFERPYLESMVPHVLDMIDQTIGVLKAAPEELASPTKTVVLENIVENYAFVAMPIDDDDAELVDVLDAVKEAASRCGVLAERVDDPDTNERITDRIVESIQKAEFVIVDLSKQKPNVYWEAGYAHGIGKIPIYIARHGTVIEFDLKDYPVIFFKNLKQLKDSLEGRMRGLASEDGTQT